MDDKRIQAALTADEYKKVMIERIDRVLREADVPESLRRDTLSFLSSDGYKSVLSDVQTKHTQTVPRAARTDGTSTSRPHVDRGDKRTKYHWPAKGARPVENPSTINDVVLNAMFNGCRTVPELVRVVQHAKVSKNRDIRKAVYTALWSLKDDGIIDQGDPQD